MGLGSYREIKQKLSEILSYHGITEFKCKKLKSAQYRFAAKEMIDYSFGLLMKGIMRVDVLMWDIMDSRHHIFGRDDKKNLQIMYYHLIENTLCTRWPPSSLWYLFPDENSSIKWGELFDCLHNSSVKVLFQQEFGKVNIHFRKEYILQCLCPVSSKKNPIVQLCDLFIGLGICSYLNFDDLLSYIKQHSQQPSLFGNVQVEYSNKNEEQFHCIQYLKQKCKTHKLGVSLSSAKGLLTRKPSNPINYWFYSPQGDYDKAPVRP